MNWDSIGAIGEILGAIAVIGTLFYLAKQIRQQNSISEYQAFNDVQDKFSALHHQYFSNPSIIEMTLRGNKDPESLSSEEAILFQFVWREYCNTTSMGWRAYQKGLIPENEWILIGRNFAGDSSTPGGKKWRSMNGIGSDEFWEAIDSLKEHKVSWSYSMESNANDT